MAGGLKGGLEHQIFWWISGDEQLGKYDEIGALRPRLLPRASHLLRVAGNVADRAIELRDGNCEPIGRTNVHGTRLAPARTRGNRRTARRRSLRAILKPGGCGHRYGTPGSLFLEQLGQQEREVDRLLGIQPR